MVFAGLPHWPSWFGERAARPEQVPCTPSPGLQQYELAFWWRFLQPLCLGLVMAGARVSGSGR